MLQAFFRRLCNRRLLDLYCSSSTADMPSTSPPVLHYLYLHNLSCSCANKLTTSSAWPVLHLHDTKGTNRMARPVLQLRLRFHVLFCSYACDFMTCTAAAPAISRPVLLGLYCSYAFDFTATGEALPAGRLGAWHFDKRTYFDRPPPRLLRNPPPGARNDLVPSTPHLSDSYVPAYSVSLNCDFLLPIITSCAYRSQSHVLTHHHLMCLPIITSCAYPSSPHVLTHHHLTCLPIITSCAY